MRHGSISDANPHFWRQLQRIGKRFADSCASPFRLDLRSLAAMRMALGVTLLLDLSIRARDLLTHYGVHGVLPCTSLSELAAPYHWDLFACREEPLFVEAHFALHALAALCLTLGLFTRASTFVCWVLMMSLQHRLPVVLNAGDDLLRLLLLWCVFLPLGARASLDALRKPARPEDSTLSGATIAFYAQVLVVYPLAVLGRQEEPSWWDGSALARIVEFDLWATRLGVSSRAYPWLLHILNYATLVWESLGPLLALLPVFGRERLRTAVVASFIAFHVGIGSLLNVGLFPLISIAAWLGFLPRGFWELVLKRRSLATPPSPPRRARGEWLLTHVLASALLLYTVTWNVQRAGMHALDALFPASVAAPGQALHVDQEWNVFAAPPSRRADGWFMVVATLENGERVDLLRQGAAASFDKPEYVLDNMPSRRWSKLLMALKKKERHRSRFLDVYAREWNAESRCERQIVRSELLFMPEQSHGESDKRVLWQLTQRWRRPECAASRAQLSAIHGR